MVACNSEGQTPQPSQRRAVLPEQHLPAGMLEDHIERVRPRTRQGAVTLEQAVCPSKPGGSSILRERQKLLRQPG